MSDALDEAIKLMDARSDIENEIGVYFDRQFQMINVDKLTDAYFLGSQKPSIESVARTMESWKPEDWVEFMFLNPSIGSQLRATADFLEPPSGQE